MTERRKKPAQDTGLLKALLITGAAAATLIGTRMLSIQDIQAQAIQVPAGAITIESAPTTSTNLNNFAPDNAVILDLQPVPQALQANIQPIQRVRPVVRTHSS